LLSRTPKTSSAKPLNLRPRRRRVLTSCVCLVPAPVPLSTVASGEVLAECHEAREVINLRLHLPSLLVRQFEAWVKQDRVEACLGNVVILRMDERQWLTISLGRTCELTHASHLDSVALYASLHTAQAIEVVLRIHHEEVAIIAVERHEIMRLGERPADDHLIFVVRHVA